MQNCVYWIWMQHMFGIATRRSHALTESGLSPRELYERAVSGSLALDERERALLPASLEQAKRIEDGTRKKGCDIVTPEHPAYPELLDATYAKPLALYVKGDLSCLREGLAIAMVGSRDATEYGLSAARDIAGGLARAGAVVVSGLAMGIDSACHIAAMEAGGLTVGVMGCGIDVDYPKGSAKIKSAMKERGAVMTEYPLGLQPLPGTFPPRNRVIAGMCRGTAVIEAGLESGALITARHALDAGRDVFAVPGSIYSARHAGVHRLLRDGGAKAVGCAADILEEYPEYIKSMLEMHKSAAAGTALDNGEELLAQAKGRPSRKKAKAAQESGQSQESPAPPELPGDTPMRLRRVWRQVGDNPRTCGVIAGLAEVDVGEAMAALTELEIMGYVKSHPGGFFSW